MNSSLRAARLRKCWSVERASAEANVSVRTYQRWEHGRCMPHLSSLSLLCEAFKLTPGELGFGSMVGDDAINEVSQPEPAPSPMKELVGTGVTAGTTVYHLPQRRAEKWGGAESIGAYVHIAEADRRFPEMEGLHGKSMTRRHAFAYLIGVPAGAWGLTQAGNPFEGSIEDVNALYEQAIPDCWDLYYTGGQTEVAKVIPAYISQLTLALQKPSRYTQGIARHLSLAYQLGSILALEQEDFHTALEHCKQGKIYAEQARDVNLQAAALLRQVDVLLFRKRHTQRLNVLREAATYVSEVSPLLRGRIYSGLAEIHAYQQDEHAALRYIGLAHNTYPDHPEDDPHYYYTHANRYMLFSDAGLTYLHLGQYDQAEQAFTRAGAFVPTTINSRRAELLCWQTLTAAREGNLEQSTVTLQQAIHTVNQLGSDVYYTEAREAYEAMLLRWRQETRVRALNALFSL